MGKHCIGGSLLTRVQTAGKLDREWFSCDPSVVQVDCDVELRDEGAQIQRPLWASTGTKNAAYSDTLYVLPLVGRHTVNTMTLETIEAVRDHGQVVCDAICQEREQAMQVLDDLQRIGISRTDVTDQLTQEGVEKFRKSLQSLLSVISSRRQELVSSRS